MVTINILKKKKNEKIIFAKNLSQSYYIQKHHKFIFFLTDFQYLGQNGLQQQLKATPQSNKFCNS